MSYRRRLFIALAAAALTLSLMPPAFAADSKASLSADNLNYNVNTKESHAQGNVIITRGDATIWGGKADGFIDKSFQVTGNVKGKFNSRKVLLLADKVLWTAGTDKNNGKIEAISNVEITHDANDKLSAEFVRWWIDTGNYLARGRVRSVYKEYVLNCAEAERTKNTFRAIEVKRFESRTDKYILSANRVDGITEGESISEVVADGNVAIDYVDRENHKTHVTGSKAVYSKARGTVVISGGARAVRTDGKTVSADTIVIHNDTKTIDAVGNSKITFIMNDSTGSKGVKKQ